jgi:hypothetical protein
VLLITEVFGDRYFLSQEMSALLLSLNIADGKQMLVHGFINMIMADYKKPIKIIGLVPSISCSAIFLSAVRQSSFHSVLYSQ